MSDYIGAWERRATIFLVDTLLDKDIFFPLLQKMEEEHALVPALTDAEAVRMQLDKAYECLAQTSGEKFICMFIWDFSNQAYLPFCSDSFVDSDTESIVNTIKSFITFSIDCCSNGFLFKTMNEENKLLALAIQALCENEMMQRSLAIYESKSNDE